MIREQFTTFLPENDLLYAVMGSLPDIPAATYRLIVKYSRTFSMGNYMMAIQGDVTKFIIHQQGFSAMICIQEITIRFKMQTEVTTISYHANIKMKVRDLSENVRHKSMYKDGVLYPSVYPDIHSD